jgi:hypothetical protein
MKYFGAFGIVFLTLSRFPVYQAGRSAMPSLYLCLDRTKSEDEDVGNLRDRRDRGGRFLAACQDERKFKP